MATATEPKFRVIAGEDFVRTYRFVGLDLTAGVVKTQIRAAPGGDIWAEADNDAIGGLVVTVTPASGDDPVTSQVDITVLDSDTAWPTTLPSDGVTGILWTVGPSKTLLTEGAVTVELSPVQ